MPTPLGSTWWSNDAPTLRVRRAVRAEPRRTSMVFALVALGIRAGARAPSADGVSGELGVAALAGADASHRHHGRRRPGPRRRRPGADLGRTRRHDVRSPGTGFVNPRELATRARGCRRVGGLVALLDRSGGLALGIWRALLALRSGPARWPSAPSASGFSAAGEREGRPERSVLPWLAVVLALGTCFVLESPALVVLVCVVVGACLCTWAGGERRLSDSLGLVIVSVLVASTLWEAQRLRADRVELEERLTGFARPARRSSRHGRRHARLLRLLRPCRSRLWRTRAARETGSGLCRVERVAAGEHRGVLGGAGEHSDRHVELLLRPAPRRDEGDLDRSRCGGRHRGSCPGWRVS